MEADFRLTPRENDNPWVRVFVAPSCRLHYHVRSIDLLIRENNMVYLSFHNRYGCQFTFSGNAGAQDLVLS